MRWNLPHLLLLAGLPVFLWAAGAAGWPPQATLAVGTLVALAALMAAERLWPHRRAWSPRWGDLRRDGIFLGVNAVADALAGLVLHGLVIAWAMASPGEGLAAAWPLGLAVPVAVVLGELGPYLLHRWAHRGGLGWRVHGVHHRPEALNASNNVTTHPLNVMWNRLSRTLPWLLLGFSADAVLAAALFIQVQSFATHANIAGTLGPLNRFIGTAELHRWHHSTVVDEARNFSTAIPLWDQVFGTYHLPDAAGPARVGIAAGGWPAPRDAWRLLVQPVCARCAR